MGWKTRRAVVLALLMMSVLYIETGVTAQVYERSYALVIGIDKYASRKWPDLRYAVKDAQAIATFLQKQGFMVIPLYNKRATRKNIIFQMQNKLAPRLKPHDRVLVFFSGHGYTETLGGKDFGYIVPHDGVDSSNYISMNEFHYRTLFEKVDSKPTLTTSIYMKS